VLSPVTLAVACGCGRARALLLLALLCPDRLGAGPPNTDQTLLPPARAVLDGPTNKGSAAPPQPLFHARSACRTARDSCRTQRIFALYQKNSARQHRGCWSRLHGAQERLRPGGASRATKDPVPDVPRRDAHHCIVDVPRIAKPGTALVRDNRRCDRYRSLWSWRDTAVRRCTCGRLRAPVSSYPFTHVLRRASTSRQGHASSGTSYGARRVWRASTRPSFGRTAVLRPGPQAT